MGPAAFAVTPATQRPAAVRAAVEALNLDHPFLWDGGSMVPPDAPTPDGVLCVRLPTRDEFATLSRIGPPVLFPAPEQLAYVRSIAAQIGRAHV